MLAIGQHAFSSKVDVRTDGLAGPALFQARWTIEAVAGLGRAIHALNPGAAKRIS
jgi:hypothetical protein